MSIIISALVVKILNRDQTHELYYLKVIKNVFDMNEKKICALFGVIPKKYRL